MAVVENRFVCDLSKPVQAQALKGNVFSLDNLGSRLSVLIYENGQPATISGSITANCILPDGSTVNVNGGLTTENGGSKAYVDVPQSCLLIPGILKIAIKCTSSSVITTLAAIVANVYMTKTDNVITPSQQIINDWNAEISAAIATQNAAIANQDTKINDLKSAFIKTVNPNALTEITWESGGIANSNGGNYSNSKHIRTNWFVDFSNVISFNIKSGYRARFYAYSSKSLASYQGVYNKSTQTKLSTSSATDVNGMIYQTELPSSYYWRVALFRADSADINVSEKTNIEFYTATDKTLTYEDVPADAKATSDAIQISNDKLTDYKADFANEFILLNTVVDTNETHEISIDNNTNFSHLVIAKNNSDSSKYIGVDLYIDGTYTVPYRYLANAGESKSWIISRASDNTQVRKLKVYNPNSANETVKVGYYIPSVIDPLRSNITSLEEFRAKMSDAEILLLNQTITSETPTFSIENNKHFTHKVTVKNTGSGNSFQGVQLYVNGSLAQNYTPLLAPGETAEFIIPRAAESTDVRELKWYSAPAQKGEITISYYIPSVADDIPNGEITVAQDGTGDFITIQGAVSYALNSMSARTKNVIIKVKAGKYIIEPQNNSAMAGVYGAFSKIHIIGESRENTIVQMTNTSSITNRLFDIGGNTIIENLTLKSLAEEGYTASGTTGYCIHIDRTASSGGASEPTEVYYTVVRNCKLYNECYPPIGCGLQDKQIIRLENCEFISNIVEGGAVQGAIYIHSSIDANADDMGVEIINCIAVAKDGSYAIALPNVAPSYGSKNFDEIPVTICRTIAVSNGPSVTDVSQVTHMMTEECALNNVDALNYSAE